MSTKVPWQKKDKKRTSKPRGDWGLQTFRNARNRNVSILKKYLAKGIPVRSGEIGITHDFDSCVPGSNPGSSEPS